MKLYKLSQGSTFENLKHFIYITNEYGVLSAEFADAFIDQFGKVILNGNFTFNQTQFQQLDSLWVDIVKECEYNEVEYTESYGRLFYTVIGTKAVEIIKEGWEDSEWNQLTESDKLELLKQFITDFDTYKDELLISCKKDSIEQKYNYKLVDEMYIGYELTITESADDISVQYKAKVIDDVNIQLENLGSIVNINKFIEETEGRVEEISIKLGFFRFEDVYTEDK